MKKLEKLLDKFESIEQSLNTIFFYLLMYSFSICFIILGIIVASSIPTTDTPGLALIFIGSMSFLMGLYFLFLAIKNTLEIKIYQNTY